MKPGIGWAQCIELSPPFAYSANGKLPPDSALGQVDFSLWVIRTDDSVFKICTNYIAKTKRFSCEERNLNI
jgi:hypothetical protein